MPGRWGGCEGQGSKERSLAAALPGAPAWALRKGSCGVTAVGKEGLFLPAEAQFRQNSDGLEYTHTRPSGIYRYNVVFGNLNITKINL